MDNPQRRTWRSTRQFSVGAIIIINVSCRYNFLGILSTPVSWLYDRNEVLRKTRKFFVLTPLKLGHLLGNISKKKKVYQRFARNSQEFESPSQNSIVFIFLANFRWPVHFTQIHRKRYRIVRFNLIVFGTIPRTC